MAIKAIVMDVDGTLTTGDKDISKRTKEVLLRAQRDGILLVLASGRPTTGLTELGKKLKMHENEGLFVSFNGAKVIDVPTMETLFDQPMLVEDGKAVLEHLKQFDVKPMIDKENYLYVNDVFDNIIMWDGEPFNVVEYESRGGNFLLCEHDDLAEFVDYPLSKILVAGDPEYLREHCDAMQAPFAGTLNAMFTGPFYFEYTAKDIDKAKALDTVLRARGIKPEEVISFGDGHNDMSIIEYAGIGVAMANAVDDLKDAADEVTLSNEEDGIAVSLEKHLGY